MPISVSIFFSRRCSNYIPVWDTDCDSSTSSSRRYGAVQQIIFIELQSFHRLFEIFNLDNRGSVKQSFLDIKILFHDTIKIRLRILWRTKSYCTVNVTEFKTANRFRKTSTIWFSSSSRKKSLPRLHDRYLSKTAEAHSNNRACGVSSSTSYSWRYF